MASRRFVRQGAALVGVLAGTGGAAALCAPSSLQAPETQQPASVPLWEPGWSKIANPALRHAVESGRLAAITGVGAVGILGILFLAMRTERRAMKTTDFVNFVTAVLNRSPAVVTRSGRVLASGKYQLAFTPTTAAGWFGVDAPTRNVRGRVHVDAARQTPRAEWDVKSLRIEFDRAQLDAANAHRDAVAVAAGYRQAAAAAVPAATSADGGGAASAATGSGIVAEGASKDAVVIHVV